MINGNKKRVWQGLIEYAYDSEDIMNKVEFGIEGICRTLKKLEPNQYIVATTIDDKKIFDSDYFQKYLENLNSFGFDVGKGNSEYGYKMPLPKNKKNFSRDLIIFRRWKEE